MLNLKALLLTQHICDSEISDLRSSIGSNTRWCKWRDRILNDILLCKWREIKLLVHSRSVVSDSLWPLGPWPASLSVQGDSPGKNTGVGCHALLQGTFPNHGLKPGLLHCRQILYHLSHKGGLKMLENVCFWFEHLRHVQLPYLCGIYYAVIFH